MDDIERLKTALRVVQYNLMGSDIFDSLKPLSAQNCSNLAEYIQHILDGATPPEAANRMSANANS